MPAPGSLRPEEEPPLETFLGLAGAVTADVGLSTTARDELSSELVEHLVEAWGARVSRGVSPHRATRQTLAAFGDVADVRRAFLVRRLRRDLTWAARMPGPWVLFAVVDATLGVLEGPGTAAPAAVSPSLMGAFTFVLSAVCLNGLALAGFRLGWRWCRYAATRRAARSEFFSGAGVIACALGLLLFLGPSAIFRALCDVIDHLAGDPLPVAVILAAVGATSLVRGAWGTMRHQPHPATG